MNCILRSVAIWLLDHWASNGMSPARGWAVRAIGRWGGESAVGVLEGYLGCWDPEVRSAAAEALAGIGGPRAKEVLLRAALTSTANKGATRVIALRGLARIGAPPEAAWPLIRLRQEGDHPAELYPAAEDALASIGPPAIEPLVQVLCTPISTHPSLTGGINEPPFLINRFAAEILARIGQPGVAALVRLLAYEEAYVRREAARALGQVEGTEAMRATIRGGELRQ